MRTSGASAEPVGQPSASSSMHPSSPQGWPNHHIEIANTTGAGTSTSPPPQRSDLLSPTSTKVSAQPFWASSRAHATNWACLVTDSPPQAKSSTAGPGTFDVACFVPNTARCTGCGRCIAVCPVHVLTFETERWTKFAVLMDADPCTGCSLCEARCPFNAITMRPAAQVQPSGADDRHAGQTQATA